MASALTQKKITKALHLALKFKNIFFGYKRNLRVISFTRKELTMLSQPTCIDKQAQLLALFKAETNLEAVGFEPTPSK